LNSFIKNNRKHLQEISQKYNVETLYLFGSAGSDNFNKSSDIDFLVNFSDKIDTLDYADNYFGLQKELEELFGRKVDLVIERSIDNPYLKESISRTKRKVYDRKGKKVSF
jgi:predicted nucleotidyltransferase